MVRFDRAAPRRSSARTVRRIPESARKDRRIPEGTRKDRKIPEGIRSGIPVRDRILPADDSESLEWAEKCPNRRE